MKTICLNMIVKNERHVIRRCLEALKGHIDYWVIVDTGSSDGTQQEILEVLKGCPGELYERPWVSFEHNRNEALRMASGKGDYLLLVDADEVIHILPGFSLLHLKKDYYLVKTSGGGQEFYFPKLIKNSPLWRWVGLLHETLAYDKESEGDFLADIWTESMQDGARSLDPQTQQKDILLLQQMIAERPHEARSYFYLAQTYFKCKRLEEALYYYKLRGQMEGAFDETFWSLFFKGQIEQWLQLDPKVFIQSYLKAYAFDPSRAEPLERIATYYVQRKEFVLAYILMKEAKKLPLPTTLSSGCYFWVYQFTIDTILADCAVQLQKINEAQELYYALLKKQNLPEGLVRHIKNQLVKIDEWIALPLENKKSVLFSPLLFSLTFAFKE